MKVDDVQLDKQPGRIIAFDSSRAKETGDAVVDLESPFFDIRRPGPKDCTHENFGVFLDVATRSAYCKHCQKDVDLFDALMIYARAQQRLVRTRQEIEEHTRKDRERRELQWRQRRFTREVTAARRERFYTVLTLSCGHERRIDQRKAPKTGFCQVCMDEAAVREKELSVGAPR